MNYLRQKLSFSSKKIFKKILIICSVSIDFCQWKKMVLSKIQYWKKSVAGNDQHFVYFLDDI